MGKRPLEGIRVLDSTYVFALPYTGALLADMGAEVIKIEGPSRPDVTRTGGLAGTFPDNEPGDDWWNRSSTYNLINRGKLSLTMDLTSERARELFKELVSISDVVMENYTPRVMRNWGLDYASLRQVKPDIIVVSNTGYGHGDGPFSGHPAQATTQEATHGLCWVTGYADGPPAKAGASYVDFISTWSALLAIGGALRHRNRTGTGQWIDLGMYQGGAMCISEYLMDYMVNGRMGTRIGNRHPHRAPQGCYPARGDDRWVVLSVGDEGQWEALCGVMGRPELASDPMYATTHARIVHHDDLDEVVGSWTRTLDRYDVMAALQAEGIPSAPVLDGRDTHLDPHFRARGFLENVTFPGDRGIGTRPLMGPPYKFSKTRLSIKGPAPAFGEHNSWALNELLGVSESEYADLFEGGIIDNVPGSREPSPTLPMDELVAKGRLAGWDPDYKSRLGIS